MCRLAETMMWFSHGLSGSVTNACNGWITSGVRNPTICVTCVVQPATAERTRRVLTKPRSVWTPRTAPSRTSMPVTRVFWWISAPRRSAPRA